MARVLIVDDKEENLYYLQALLAGHGYEVIAARHGAEALAMARAQRPDLVVSDLLMPVMDGYTLLRHWARDPRLRAVPFVVYTATYTEPEDEQLALRLGATAFLLKPCEPDDLVAKLREAISLPRARANEPPDEPDETGLLREYSETLIRKLEQKTLELEEANRTLREDVEARRVAEAALRESEERFRQLAESVDDVFWLSDTQDGTLFYVSPAFERIWGRTCASLYAEPHRVWLEAVHPLDRSSVAASLAVYREGGWNLTYRILRPDGEVRWIRARAYPVRDSGGRVYRVAGIARDITRYRQLEEQLRQAQKMEAIGLLAGGVAHDFNNLLSVILSYTRLVLDDLQPEHPVRADIEQIQIAGDRAAQLTKQLLAFSCQQVLRPSVIDLRQVVGDMQRMLARLVGDDVVIATELAEGAGHVLADAGQIEQVIMNLVVNARDAMPTGGTIRLRVEPVALASGPAAWGTSAAATHVMLAVTDDGIGMDETTRARIFEPFFTTKKHGKGTGLGLPTVFGIIQQSGGEIEVESEPGLGTTFRIYLPRTEAAASEAEAPAPVVLTALGGRETILLVDDDPQVLESSAAILQRHGYRVLCAASGADAIALSDRLDDRIDLLVTDVVMPRASGLGLAEELSNRRPGLKVLYVSGYAERSLRDGLSQRASRFLQKPITPELLLRSVRDVLGTRDGA